MIDHVLFLGAGASRPFGYALTGEILRLVWRRARNKSFQLDDLNDHAEHIVRAIETVIPATNEHGPETLSITDVLSLLDHCTANDERVSPALEISDARELLELAIADVLIKPVHKPWRSPKELVAWIRSRDGRERSRTAVISTNYDFAVDIELLNQNLDDFDDDYWKTDFGFAWQTVDDGELVVPARNPRVTLYKLHGALNWLKCHRCSLVYVNFSITLADFAGGDGLGSTCHCGEKPLRLMLVAPSFVRSVKDANLLSIWLRAGAALRKASTWTFVGYSLPPEDIAIRSLLLRAWHARDERPNIRVFEKSSDAANRYRELFPGAEVSLDGLDALLGVTKPARNRNRRLAQR